MSSQLGIIVALVAVLVVLLLFRGRSKPGTGGGT